MRIIFLSNMATIIVDVVAWLFFHLSIGFWSSRIPFTRFNPEKPWYQTKKWEKGGTIYQKFFHVKSWKKFIPSGADVYPDTFRLKEFASFKLEYIERWLIESCRAEFCHWTMILPGFLFFLWNSIETGWWMVVYAVLNNMVPIIMQRYNRPRVRKLLQHIQKQSNIQGECHVTFDPQNAFSNSYQ